MKRKINKNQFLLAIDIGNTTVSLAVFKGKKIISRKLIQALGLNAAPKDLVVVFKHFKKQWPLLETCLVCSVVPKSLKIVASLLRAHVGLTPLVVGKDVRVPLKSRYAPGQIGQDRLVCAYAARELYGTPLIVIDLGTAITCDVVSSKGVYEGGIIIPGLRLSAESLFSKTALLPNVPIERPCDLIGRNTKASILSGIFFGYGALLDGLVARIEQQEKMTPKVILTGGYAKLMHGFMQKKVDHVNATLVFEGLKLLSCRF